MVSSITMAPPYRTVRVHTEDGREVKMKVRRELLNPNGTDVAAKVNFSGVNIYVHNGEEIKVGSAPTCDIVINDSNLSPEHIKIVHTANGVIIEPINPTMDNNSTPKDVIK